MTSPPPTRPRRAARAQRGQSSGDYAGIIIVAVLLALALIAPAPTWGQKIAEGITCAIGRIVGEGCTPGAEPPPNQAEDFRPPQCTVGSTTDGYNASVKIAFVKLGEDHAFVVTESVTRNPDGTTSPKYVVTATDGGTLGAEGGVGGELRFGSSDIGAKIDAGAGLSLKVGDQWEFTSKADYDAFKEQWDAYEIQQLQIKHAAMNGVPYIPWGGMVDPPPGPTHTTTSVDLESSLGLTLGAFIFDDSGSAEPDKPFDLNLGAYAKVKAGQKVAITTDHRPGHEGERATTLTYTASGNAGVNAIVVGGDVWDGSYSGAIKISEKPGPDGKPQISSVTFTTSIGADVGLDPKLTSGPISDHSISVSSDDKAQTTTVTTTTIEVDDSNRAIVEQWMRDSYEMTSAGGGDPMLLPPPNAMAPTEPVPNDAMANLLYQDGRTTIEKFQGSDNNFGLGGSVALGLKFGADVGLTDEESNRTASVYLQDRGTDGIRRFADNDLC